MDPYTWTSRENIRLLAEKIKPKSTILDVGAGPQWAKSYFEKNNHKYLACDVEQSRFSKIQDFFVVDEHLPIPDRSIDVLISNSVLEHLRNPSIALSEYHRVLKPKGVLYLQTNFLYQEHGNPHDYLRFTLEMIQILVTENGFKISRGAKIGSRFALVIDNISAYYVRKIAIVLQFFFEFETLGKVLLAIPRLVLSLSNAILGALIFTFLLLLRILGNFSQLKDHNFYPGVYIVAEK